VAPVWFEIRERHGATEFLGYATTRAEGRIVALVQGGAAVERAAAGAAVEIVTNQTPFYGESGGQIGDTGEIRVGSARARVTDTRRLLGDLHVHVGEVEAGAIAALDAAELVVDAARRAAIRRAHSATHLLHAALRRHLGDHVAQKGSLVAPDRLRFDFSHLKPMTAEELATVEAEVNAHLRQNDAVTIRLMARDDAIAAGAMALFGEKYGEEVRVVAMGRDADRKVYSIELCGGTHVERTGDVALFEIESEAAVAAGVRRIEALVGEAAYAAAVERRRRLAEVAGLLRTPDAEAPARVQALLEERRRLERELADTRRRLVTGAGAAAEGAKLLGDVRFAGRVVDGLPAKELRGTVDALKKDIGSGVVALVAVNDGKASVVVSVSDDLKARFDAVALVRRAVEAVGGSGGGGRPDFAQGGGPDGARADAAIAAIEQALVA
jgi:alanyl-tRNA synthetase